MPRAARKKGRRCRRGTTTRKSCCETSGGTEGTPACAARAWTHAASPTRNSRTAPNEARSNSSPIGPCGRTESWGSDPRRGISRASQEAMRIVILGAGIGGQVVANELRRLLPGEHRVTVVERNVRHAFAPSFLWVMTGDRQPQQITRDVRELVRPGVE